MAKPLCKRTLLRLADRYERGWPSLTINRDVAAELRALAAQHPEDVVMVPALWLRQEISKLGCLQAVVLVERTKGDWVELIRETEGGPYSHIKEPFVLAAAQQEPAAGEKP